MRTHTLTGYTAAAVLLGGCVVTRQALAPGAAQVRTTQVATDVAACQAMGNVRHADAPATDLRNLVVGAGGNVLFVTVSQAVALTPQPPRDLPVASITEGIAYRCP